MRKGQIISMLSVAIVAFLVGAVFNANLLTIANTVDSLGRPTWDIYVTGGQLNVTIPHKPLQKYGDYVRIDALSWREAGVNFWGDGTYPFIFNPKGELINVTKAWVSVVISIVGNRPQTIYLYLNNNPIYSWEFPPIQRLKITFPITNSTVLQSIKPGVNIIQERHTPVTTYEMFMHEVTIFIEYEYQA